MHLRQTKNFDKIQDFARQKFKTIFFSRKVGSRRCEDLTIFSDLGLNSGMRGERSIRYFFFSIQEANWNVTFEITKMQSLRFACTGTIVSVVGLLIRKI